jgi:ABC-2 type transport system permease protein
MSGPAMAVGPPLPSTRVKGPSALGSDRRRLARLTWLLAVTDFRLRFFGSALGYLWQLVQPLLLFGVLYLVFSVLLNFSGTERFYPVALLLGIVLFSFLSESTSSSVRSLLQRESLVRKVEFPRLAVPGAAVLTATFNLGLNLLPVVIFLLASGGTIRWTWLEVPLLIAVLIVFVMGFAMLLSALFVRYRDVEPIWTVVLQVMFYATPIFYTVSLVQSKAGDTVLTLMMCNPFAAVLQQARHALVDPTHASVADAMAHSWMVAIPLVVALATFAIGFAVFARAAPRVAEEL